MALQMSIKCTFVLDLGLDFKTGGVQNVDRDTLQRNWRLGTIQVISYKSEMPRRTLDTGKGRTTHSCDIVQRCSLF